MSVVTFEGVVEQGQVKLPTNVCLPENAKVFVVVPEMQIEGVAKISSPRLAHPEQAKDFEIELIEEPTDASV
jgi:hypothetical protein